ncbi:MAG: tetratricopeptide repeat protein [Acidobacteriota bacterium]|nr:tetratricopeptide repeat protein [Acidobacteriota bacterium]
MQQVKNKFALVVFLVSTLSLASACGGVQSAKSNPAVVSVPPAAPIASEEAANDGEIRFFESKVKNDPEDFGANNKLAALYLQKLRETGSAQYLELAARAARASLASVPDVRNAGGLAALALTEFASHAFVPAKQHALRLIELEPQKSYSQGILGDALVELGEYDQAEIAYKKITLLDNGMSDGSETRFARIAQLKGDNAGAQKHFASALTLALNQSVPRRETVAWICWQLGETAFSVGDYETAEKHYLEALTTFPDYYRAIASLGRVRAARGDSPGAIAQYEKVTRILPDPTYVAALGDLYWLSGREEDAKKQYELVEQIGHLSELNGALYNRQLALFYADHDIKTEEAYTLAAKEYEVRKDIYGADALAWTAFKANKIVEAQAAIKDALRLGTQDAKIFYHAGIISDAAGDKSAARDFIRRALALNPQFDALQRIVARKILEN